MLCACEGYILPADHLPHLKHTQCFARRSYRRQARGGASGEGGGTIEDPDADWCASGDDGSEDEGDAKDK